MPGNSHTRAAETGVSLVEVLVVLSIVAVLAGALGLSLGSVSRTAGPSEVAERLVTRLARASEIAGITGTPAALIWDEIGYRFVQHSDGDWVAHTTPLLADPVDLPADLRLADAGSGTGAARHYVLMPEALPLPGEQPLELVVRDRDGGTAWRIAHNGATGTARPMTGLSR